MKWAWTQARARVVYVLHIQSSRSCPPLPPPPGIDHMTALRLIKGLQGRGGKITRFTSLCGGLPAPEAADNPIGYKFSWSPIGVLRAATNVSCVSVYSLLHVHSCPHQHRLLLSILHMLCPHDLVTHCACCPLPHQRQRRRYPRGAASSPRCSRLASPQLRLDCSLLIF